MSRTAAFNYDSTLHQAMDVFWRQGYGATSIKDLTAATGLQPGSLYGAFKSKRELFLAALDAYFVHTREYVHRVLHGEGPPLHRIRAFFAGLIEQASRDPDQKGCLLVNTLLEIPADDTEINQRVSNMFAEVEGQFRLLLEQAQENGELAKDKQPAALARLLMTGIYGLRVYHKTCREPDCLQAIVAELLSVLE